MKPIFDVLIFIAVFISVPVFGIEMDAVTEKCVEDSLRRYESSCPRAWRVDAENVSLDGIAEKWRFFLPSFILWCPMTTYNIDITCPVHGTELSAGNWQSTSVAGNQPRLLYGIKGNCLLVGRVYQCRSVFESHRFLSTDPDILGKLPCFVNVPFLLTHRSGCTREFVTFLFTQLSLGNNFLEIENVLLNIQYNNFIDRWVFWLGRMTSQGLDLSQTTIEDVNMEFRSSVFFTSPGDDLLISIFLDYFEREKEYYEQAMSGIIASCISMDHTFKISKNIGLERPLDSKWVRQYESLFLIMNEVGQVASWCLTKGSSFAEVESFLIRFRDRLADKSKTLEFAIIDNCCQWRGKLQSVFGPGLIVKLDIFHAVQRFTQTLPKRLSSHFARKLCSAEFSLVFRNTTDLGPKRQQDTPPPNVMIQNLDNFISKWKGCAEDLLTNSSIQAIEHIREHITKGCLSRIPPGQGTERNEGLHSYLNRSLLSGATRIGPELAFALLTVLFYSHNCRAGHSKKKSKVHVYQPSRIHFLESLLGNTNNLDRLSVNSEQFGLARDSDRKLDGLRGWVKQGEYERKGENQAAALLPSSIESVDQLMKIGVCEYIIRYFYDEIEIMNSFKRQCFGKDSFHRYFLIRNEMDLMQHLLHGRGSSDNESVNEHEFRLSRHLASFALEKEEVLPDGDCLFQSVCVQLHKEMFESESQRLIEHLEEINPDFLSQLQSETLPPSAKFHLRQLFVRFATENVHKYGQYLNMNETEALSRIHQFSKVGVFSGSVGDIVVMVIAELLRCPIIVITSMEAVSVVPLIPENPVHHQPMYIAFNQSGPGHYDATRSATVREDPQKRKQQETERQITESVKCKCGREKTKTDENYKSCVNTEDRKYKTRCPCFKNGQICSTDACKCVNCFNGKPSSKKEQKGIPMKRKRKQITQRKKTTSMQFLMKENEEIRQGTWTDYETCFLEVILNTLSKTSLRENGNNAHTLYMHVASSEIARETGLPIRSKSLTQVQGKLTERKETLVTRTKFIEQQLKKEISVLQI